MNAIGIRPPLDSQHDRARLFRIGTLNTFLAGAIATFALAPLHGETPTGTTPPTANPALQGLEERHEQQSKKVAEIENRFLEELVDLAADLQLETPAGADFTGPDDLMKSIMSHVRKILTEERLGSDSDVESPEITDLRNRIARLESTQRELLVNQQIGSYLAGRIQQSETEPPEEPSGSWQFRSFSSIAGETRFSIHNPEKNLTFWATEGQVRHGLEIIRFNSNENTLHVRFEGEESMLPLMQSPPGIIRPDSPVSHATSRMSGVQRMDVEERRELWQNALQDSERLREIENRISELVENLWVSGGPIQASRAEQEERDQWNAELRALIQEAGQELENHGLNRMQGMRVAHEFLLLRPSRQERREDQN